MTRHILRMLEDGELETRLTNADFFADRYLIRRNVYFSSADLNVPVAYKLTGLAARSRKTESEHDVVEATFQLLQEHFTGHAFGARGFLKVVAELAFLREVDSLCFLLLAELQAVAYDFGLTIFAVLARGKVPFFDGALVGEALRAFEE